MREGHWSTQQYVYCEIAQQSGTLQRESCSEPEQHRGKHGPDLKQKQRRKECLSPRQRRRRAQVGQIGLRREEQRHKKPAAYDHTSNFPVLLDQASDIHCGSCFLRVVFSQHILKQLLPRRNPLVMSSYVSGPNGSLGSIWSCWCIVRRWLFDDGLRLSRNSGLVK